MSFCNQLDAGIQELFAFEGENPPTGGCQFCWTVLPQGFTNSHAISRKQCKTVCPWDWNGRHSKMYSEEEMRIVSTVPTSKGSVSAQLMTWQRNAMEL